MLILILAVAKRGGPPPVWIWYVLAASILVAALVLVLTRRYERRRSEALSAAALQHGMSYDAEGQPFTGQQVPAIELFNTGRTREARNVMRGSSGGNEITLFDYKYVTGSGKNQSVHQQTVAAFRLPGAGLPVFQLRHEGLFAKLASALGYQDIDFPDHPEFSRRYLLRGKDESAIRTAFSPALIDFFEQLAPGEKWWTVEGAGDVLVIYRADARVRPEELAQFLQDTTTIAAQFRQGSAAKFGH